MQKTSVILLLLLCGGLLSGCFLFGGDDDDNPQPQPIDPIDLLPPLTTEGKGTFGCLVNGEAFVSRFPDALADYTVFDNILLRADVRSLNASIGISISPYSQEEIIFYKPNAFIQYDFRNDSNDCTFRLKDNINGYIEVIEYNPFERYISGTFEYTAVNETCDTVRITDGRFDLPVVR